MPTGTALPTRVLLARSAATLHRCCGRNRSRSDVPSRTTAPRVPLGLPRSPLATTTRPETLLASTRSTRPPPSAQSAPPDLLLPWHLPRHPRLPRPLLLPRSSTWAQSSQTPRSPTGGLWQALSMCLAQPLSSSLAGPSLCRAALLSPVSPPSSSTAALSRPPALEPGTTPRSQSRWDPLVAPPPRSSLSLATLCWTGTWLSSSPLGFRSLPARPTPLWRLLLADRPPLPRFRSS